MKMISEMMFDVNSYKMLAPGYRERMKAALEALELKGGEMLLEVGCGSGENTEIMKKIGAHVTALEISKEEMRAARKRLDNSVNFIICDAQNLPFRNKSFIKLLCLSVLEHIPDDTSAAKEIARVMNTKGHGVVGVPSEYTPFFRDPINFILRKLGRKPLKIIGGRAWGHYRHYTDEEAKKLLKSSGLAIKKFERIEHSIVALCHFYFPEIYTFLIRPIVRRSGNLKMGGKKRTYGTMYKTLSRLSEWISNQDRKLSGSYSGYCIKVEKVDK